MADVELATLALCAERQRRLTVAAAAASAAAAVVVFDWGPHRTAADVDWWLAMVIKR